MSTEKIFQRDVYAKTLEATVTETETVKGKPAVVLDKTIFFPEGGGQPTDTGNISGVPVTHVSEKDGVIYHFLDLSSPGSGEDPAAVGAVPFKTGDTVELELDWDRRFMNMQRHAGEHVLSGAFYNLYRGANKGFHMGEDYITIDILLPDDPHGPDQVTWEMAMDCERAANKAIWQDLPITVDYFDDAAEASKLPLRKELTETIASGEAGDVISIVTVGDKADPVDCVACCGTHPSSTGQIGLIKVYKVEKNKEFWRIYLEAGMKALSDYDLKHDILTRVSDRYSAGTDDFEEKLLAEEKKNSKARARLAGFLQTILRARADEITGQIEAAPGDVIFKTYDDMTCDDLIKMAKLFSDKAKKPVLLYSEPDGTLMLFSDGTIHCGNLVRENAHIYNGKGGGNATLSRAIFPRKDDVPVFAELVRAHLR